MIRKLLLAMSALCLLFAGAGCHAQEPYTDLSSKPVGKIYFNSLTPKTYYALMHHAAQAPRTLVYGTLYMPDNLEKPVPAMIFSHGSGGVMANETDRWLPFFLKMNMAVFIVDTYGSRGIVDTVSDQTQLSFGANVADALFALKLLATDPRVDATRIGQIGFSRGGTVVLDTMFERFRHAVIEGDAPKFAAHVAFYPSCSYIFYGPQAAFTGKPVMFALGSADDYTSAATCVSYANHLKQVVPRVEVQVYDGAYHDFDSVKSMFHWLPNAVSGAKCKGTEIDIDTFAVTDVATGTVYKDQNAYPGGIFGCEGKGATVANNWAAARKSEADVRSFITSAMNLQ